jgi:hypothetical protein
VALNLHPSFTTVANDRLRQFGSKNAQQRQNQHDDQKQSETARRTITPGPAVGPCGNRTQQKQNQDNEQNGAERHRVVSWHAIFEITELHAKRSWSKPGAKLTSARNLALKDSTDSLSVRFGESCQFDARRLL